jgi:hypothetical protein
MHGSSLQGDVERYRRKQHTLVIIPFRAFLHNVTQQRLESMIRIEE